MLGGQLCTYAQYIIENTFSEKMKVPLGIAFINRVPVPSSVCRKECKGHMVSFI